jgi:hypothetical protein
MNKEHERKNMNKNKNKNKNMNKNKNKNKNMNRNMNKEHERKNMNKEKNICKFNRISDRGHETSSYEIFRICSEFRTFQDKSDDILDRVLRKFLKPYRILQVLRTALRTVPHVSTPGNDLR